MNTRVIAVGSLTDDQVRAVLTAATAAPSLYDSRPWWFRCTPTAIEVHADITRAAPATDPDHRDLFLACGAALLNLRLAIRAAGVYPAVRLVQDPGRPDLLAIVTPHGHGLTIPVDQRLAAAISRRHTDQTSFAPTTITVPVLNALRQAAKAEQAWMTAVTTEQLPALHRLLHDARDAQHHDPAFITESTHRNGTPGSDTGAACHGGRRREPHDEQAQRSFSAGPPLAGDPGPGPMIAVIETFHDQPMARVQAGQAMQRVLLTATTAGLSASFLSAVVQIPATRSRLRELIGGLWPQTVLRLGYAPPVPSTPR